MPAHYVYRVYWNIGQPDEPIPMQRIYRLRKQANAARKYLLSIEDAFDVSDVQRVLILPEINLAIPATA